MFLRFHLSCPEWSSTKLTSVFYHDFFLTLMKPRTTPACRASGVDRLFLYGPEPLVSVVVVLTCMEACASYQGSGMVSG